MEKLFTRHKFEKVFNVTAVITLFYMELSKDFKYDGEKHDFWEMVYIDRGEMICTADEKQFVLKGGELTFHKPNEHHNLASNQKSAPNVSIITFECKSPAMNYFGGKIFKLTPEEKGLLTKLFEEGLSAYEMTDRMNPLSQNLTRVQNAPFGSSQATKNLLEYFLIKLSRNKESLPKNRRYSQQFHGSEISYEVREIIDILEAHLYSRLSLEQIADEIGKSVSTVKNIFKTYKKNGVIHYFNYLKIKEAKRLIRESSANFTEISESLAFDTPQYFSMTFKKYTGMSPLEYKNSIIK